MFVIFMFVIFMFVIPEGNLHLPLHLPLHLHLHLPLPLPLHFPYPFPVIIRRATKQPAVALLRKNNRFALFVNPITPTLKFP